MSITLEDLRELLANRRDMLLSAVKQVLLGDAPDPFAISWDGYRELPEDDQIALTRRAHALREDHLEREFADRGAIWLLVVGQRIVGWGPDIDACPDDDEIDRIGKETGKVPYLFTRLLVEEATCPRTPWHPLPSGDAYPAIAVHIGAIREGRAALFAGPSMKADLDTGSPMVFVPWEEAESRGWPAASRVWRKDRHIGLDYEWRPCRALVGVIDTVGEHRSAEMTVLGVRKWKDGPFVRVNPARRVLVGRNLLLTLGLRVLLLAATRETELSPQS